MIKRKVKVLGLCGTGGVTSNVVTLKVKNMLIEKGYDVETECAKVMEASSKAASFRPDIVIANTPVSLAGYPVVNGIPFLTGIGIEAANAQVLKILEGQK